MATLSQILSHFWPGAEWTLTDEDYDSLNWFASNQAPKPTLLEIMERESDTDSILSENRRRDRQQNAFRDTPDYLLKSIETILDGLTELRRVVEDVRDTIAPAAHTGTFAAWDNAVISRIATLRAKVRDLRDIQ